MIDALFQVHGIPVIRVTRVKAKGETNPKSANLNNCLKQIYGDAIPPDSEVVAVFDADQAAHSNFFTATLPWMDAGDDVALVQSPQVVPSIWSLVFSLLGRLSARKAVHCPAQDLTHQCTSGGSKHRSRTRRYHLVSQKDQLLLHEVCMSLCLPPPVTSVPSPRSRQTHMLIVCMCGVCTRMHR